MGTPSVHNFTNYLYVGGCRDRSTYVRSTSFLSRNQQAIVCFLCIRITNHRPNDPYRDRDAVAPPLPSFVTHYWKPTLASPTVLSDDVPLTGYHSVTLFESRTTIESGTTGLRTWRASFVLAQFFIQNPSMTYVTIPHHSNSRHYLAILINKSVLELGSGTGFLGLIVADIQASCGGAEGCPTLHLTDVTENVLRQCSENTQLPCSRRCALCYCRCN